VAEDETVDVGADLAVIGTAGGAATAAPAAPAAPPAAAPAPKQPEPAPVSVGTESDYSAPAPEAETAAAAKPSAPAPTPSAPAAAPAAPAAQAPAGDGSGAYVTPLVRRLAAEQGVDLSTVEGTGVGGRIRKQDVLAAAEKTKQPAPAAASTSRAPSPAATPDSALRGRTEKMSRLRTVIAKRMVESLEISAQLTTVVEADVTRIANLRNQVKNDFAAREGVKLSFLPFFAKAAVEALKAHPSVNSSVDMEAGTVTYHDAENLGIAVDTERGLLVPVIRGAGDLSLAGIARKIADLAERTRANKVTPDELGGGTFTLTNTGSRGALFDTPIINQPQVAILGVGSVVKRPVVVQDPELGEVIAVRSMVYLALTYDHRIVDGADAARFLTTVRERLEAGQFQGELGLS
jgi:pyruvate dehydrogenase E2 component (dihydrolipoamide acetyltransferase)